MWYIMLKKRGDNVSISKAVKEFSEKTQYNYKHDLDNFFDYMRIIKSWTNNDKIFNAVDTDCIVDSIKFNIKNASYNSKSIARHYSVAISEFFLFAIKEGYIKNTDFYNELVGKRLDNKSYYNRVNLYISEEKRLREKESNKVFSKEHIDLLIDECNYYFKNKKNYVNLNELGACICIKLMILIGIKYTVARKLKYDDFYAGCLYIKDYKIHLPLTLKEQINIYKFSVEKILNKKPYMMFIDNNGESWGKNTGTVAYQVSKILGTTSTTGISKFGISNLLEADISDSVIAEITNAGKDFIKDCIDQKNELNKELYINSRISKIDYFYKL